ncbi:MAG: LuxR family transcriptional regulator [Solirubrobacterales bacterium]|nr:LuxR family transcriptional regulator [Solirubrobacterales bacterium]
MLTTTCALMEDVPATDHEAPRKLRLVRGQERATGTIRVAVADSQALLRAGFRVVLEREAGIVVVGEAATGEEAVALVRHTRPDVVLVDVHLPGLDPVRAMRGILAEPGVAVMLLAGSQGDDRIFAALRAGAGGLLLKDTEPAELVRAVKALARGASVLSPIVTRQLTTDNETGPTCAVIPLTGRSHRKPPPREDPMLTPKVVEIRRGCVRGNRVSVRNAPPAPREVR